MPLTVRDARSADIAAIRLVAEAAWRDTYAGLLTAPTIETFIEVAYSSERLQRRIERHTFLVAVEDDAILAFADAVEEADRLNLAAIYALPQQRGHGAGTLLLNELRARFAGLAVTADVLVGNRKGEVFYEHRGFVARETIAADLFGEPANERRWRLDARLDE
ncbi:MAG TPA: GNAT family N-acetyltransferase [Candidatus Deferrimicrobium sp.]|nr:GNAT family N-acetyltransferase [Candidatus Deferrimicrobium sp.]